MSQLSNDRFTTYPSQCEQYQQICNRSKCFDNGDHQVQVCNQLEKQHEVNV